jgi:hypothetical protein
MHGGEALMHKRLTRRLAATAVVAALVCPTAAFAQQSAQDAYKPQGQVEQDVQGVQGGSDSQGPGGGAVAGATESSGSGLPFTGMDVALLAGAGTLLLGAGVGIRRFAHRQDPV